MGITTDKYRVIRQGSYNALFEMPLVVSWEITNMCNLQCSYCVYPNLENKKIDKQKFPPFQHMMNVVQHLAELNRPYYNITLSGGEPTVHPDFVQIMDEIFCKLDRKVNSLYILSNGLTNMNNYKKIAQLSDNFPILLVNSIHCEYLDIERITDLISLFQKNGNLHFRILFKKELRETVKDVFNILAEFRKKFPFTMDIHLLRVGPNFDIIDPFYTKEDLNWRVEAYKIWNNISSNSKIQPIKRDSIQFKYYLDTIKECEYISTQINPAYQRYDESITFKDIYCSSGSSVLFIGPDGNCQGATCPQGTKSRINIFQDNPYKDEKFIDTIKCNIQYCPCLENFTIPKFSNENEANQYILAARRKHRHLFHGLSCEKK